MPTVEFSAAVINSYPIDAITSYQTYLTSISNVVSDMSVELQTLYNEHIDLTTAAVGYQSQIDVAVSAKMGFETAAATALIALNAHDTTEYQDALVAESNDTATVAQKALIADHEALVETYMLQVSMASAELSIIVTKQIDFDIQVASLNWVPPPSNDVVLDELNVLLNGQDIGIAGIQADIATISTASEMYGEFNVKMNTFKNFENLVATQLDQLGLFLKSDELIDSQETIVSELYFKTSEVINEYKTIVNQNNVKTMDVKATYETVQQRLLRLNTVSSGIGDIMTQTNQLIASKRPEFPYNRVINLPLMTGLVNDMTRIQLDITPEKLSQMGFSRQGTTEFYNLLHGFQWNSTTNMMTWVPTDNSTMVTMVFKFEVLSTTGKPFDTTTIAKARVFFANGTEAYVANTSNNKNAPFSSVNSSTIDGSINITMSPNDSVEFIMFDSSPNIVAGLISVIIL